VFVKIIHDKGYSVEAFARLAGVSAKTVFRADRFEPRMLNEKIAAGIASITGLTDGKVHEEYARRRRRARGRAA
jgi:hypothetical protein